MELALKISKYLDKHKDLRDFDNDSLNISEGVIVDWNFKNIPLPTEQELEACEAEILAEESKEAKLKQIADLEASLTPRRMREALLSGDHSLVQDVENKIQTIRETL